MHRTMIEPAKTLDQERADNFSPLMSALDAAKLPRPLVKVADMIGKEITIPTNLLVVLLGVVSAAANPRIVRGDNLALIDLENALDLLDLFRPRVAHVEPAAFNEAATKCPIVFGDDALPTVPRPAAPSETQ